MKPNSRNILLYLAAIMLIATPAAASPFSDFLGGIFSPPVGVTQVPQVDTWAGIQFKLQNLNTPGNIAALDRYMEQYNIYSVRIVVPDLGRSFDVRYGQGVVFNQNQPVQKQIYISSKNIEDIIKMVQDGNLSWYEKLKMGYMMR